MSRYRVVLPVIGAGLAKIKAVVGDAGLGTKVTSARVTFTRDGVVNKNGFGASDIFSAKQCKHWSVGRIITKYSSGY